MQSHCLLLSDKHQLVGDLSILSLDESFPRVKMPYYSRSYSDVYKLQISALIPIGVDTERKQKRNLDWFMQKSSHLNLSQDPLMRWTQIEAVAKLKGTGVFTELVSNDVVDSKLLTFTFDNHIITIATNLPVNLQKIAGV